MNRISVCYRILLIVACTLAGGSSSAFERPSNVTNATNTTMTTVVSDNDSSTCHVPCALLQKQVEVSHIAYPFLISSTSWAFMTFGSVLFKTKHRSLVVRALFWPIKFLCISIWIAYVILYFKKDKVMAYSWSLHSSGISMLSFSPKRAIVGNRVVYVLTPLICVVSICLYAWRRGPPVGIAPWISGDQAQCGWMVHLVAVLGSDLLAYLLSPLGALLWAN